MYAVDNEDSLDRIISHWLPLIRECCPTDLRKPVVLVGNKIDLVDYSTIDHVLSIMEDFPEVESCVECSAKTLHNISEMFYYAQKAVLHPTAPLYIMEEQDVSIHFTFLKNLNFLIILFVSITVDRGLQKGAGSNLQSV